MNKISITIDGIVCEAVEGEYILNVARRNNIFIPAICYVPNCSPTLACRLCMAEVDSKRVYTCNAKAKDGQVVITNSPEIEEERKSIMEVYVINHPLECGVCDKSGECELQNYVLEMQVDEQKYTIRNTHKPVKDWGLTRYDPSLCIVCERCVTVCKDVVGENALKTTSRGEDVAVAKELKDSMPKDAFAVWNKLQKSIIDKTDINGDVDCSDCGQCAEVCPVGALVVSDFHYNSNAWELTKIPAANPHSSDCSLMYYEVKQTSIENSESKIYRVEGDKNFGTLNGAAKFGYDFENRVKEKDEKAFNNAIDFIKTKADTIKFNSFITNEEALILQKIKSKYNLKLVNEDAFRYQRFLNTFSKASGESLYSGDLNRVKNSDFVVSFASFLRYDSPNSSYALNSAIKMNKAIAIYAHPITDKVVNSYSKNLLHVKYNIASEEAFLYALLDMLADKAKLDDKINSYLSSLHTKTTKTVKESVVEEIKESIIVKTKDEQSGEEIERSEEVIKKVAKEVEKEVEIVSSKLWEMMGIEDLSEQIKTLSNGKEKLFLIVGEDAITHKNWKNLANLCGLLSFAANFNVVIIPSQTNTLGVSLICELDELEGQNVLGYNEKANFTLSALGDGDLDMPALNQQEGTFTSIDKRVVPTNAALGYNGYILNDIANALDVGETYTIDFTNKLPIEKGFTNKNFDDLPNYYDNNGVEHRGYFLQVANIQREVELKEIEDISLKGNIVYRANPILQFSPFTNKAHQLSSCASLYVSEEFLNEFGLTNGQNIKLKTDSELISLKIELNKKIDGKIAYIPTFDNKLDVSKIFKDGYRFANYDAKGAEK
ncbi:MAG: NADH-quinone oxidoreductase subunit G [Campylobacteraceae bacterium]|jgi:NADH-quinone oxidoreductase subunit G|nr:NADH-quinone oxidoreductase subunit G [Campylobacteraceae bacterium]